MRNFFPIFAIFASVAIVIIIAVVMIFPEVSSAQEIGDLLEKGSEVKEFVINPFGGILEKLHAFNEWSRSEIGIDFIKLGQWIWKTLKLLAGLAIDLIERIVGSIGQRKEGFRPLNTQLFAAKI